MVVMGGWLADVITVAHAFVVLIVVLGALTAVGGGLRRHPRWERTYYGLLLVVIVANLVWGDCPLTQWEQALRTAYRPDTAYANSFIGHYLPWLPPRLLAWIGPSLMAGAFLAAPAWRWVDRRKT